MPHSTDIFLQVVAVLINQIGQGLDRVVLDVFCQKLAAGNLNEIVFLAGGQNQIQLILLVGSHFRDDFDAQFFLDKLIRVVLEGIKVVLVGEIPQLYDFLFLGSGGRLLRGLLLLRGRGPLRGAGGSGQSGAQRQCDQFPACVNV